MVAVEISGGAVQKVAPPAVTVMLGEISVRVEIGVDVKCVATLIAALRPSC